MVTFDERIKESTPSLVVFEKAGSEDNEKIEELAAGLREHFGDKLNIMKIDATHDQRMRNFYDIKHLPTWILFKEGQELARENGLKSEANLEEMVQTAMN